MARSASFRPTDDNGADIGRFVLRLTLGILILLHGIAKLPTPPDMIGEMLARFGLPAALAYAVFLGEVVAPLFLIIGVWTRAAALVVAVNMVVAVVLVHVPQLLQLGKQGGYALELQAMYLFAAIAVALLGAGRYSIGGRYGPLN